MSLNELKRRFTWLSGSMQDFTPSQICVGLLFPSSVSSTSGTLKIAQMQLTRGIASALWAIREWKSCLAISDNRIVIVSRCGVIRQEFLDEIRRKIDLDKKCFWNSYLFNVRIAEELMIWALNNPKDAESQGLKYDRSGNLVLQRSLKIILGGA